MKVMRHNKGRILRGLALALFMACFFPATVYSAPSQSRDVNGDFLFDLSVNGQDMLASQSFSVTPEQKLSFNLIIHDVKNPVEMQNFSVEIFFAGIPVGTISQPLSAALSPGDKYEPEIPPVNARDYLSVWGVNVATGKYRAVVKLEYTALGSTVNWAQSAIVEVPGNPMTTIAAAIAALASGVAFAGLIALVKSAVGFSLESQQLSGRKTLQSQARGKVAKSLVSAVKKIVVKDRCPECGEAIKHGYCPACRQPVRELQKIYRRKVRDLASAGIKLLASGEAKNVGELPEKLGIGGNLASDVTASIMNARLFQAKRAARSLSVIAATAGASSALSVILWVTIGGWAALNTTILALVIALSIILPLLITSALRIRMGRQLARVVPEHPAITETVTPAAPGDAQPPLQS